MRLTRKWAAQLALVLTAALAPFAACAMPADMSFGSMSQGPAIERVADLAGHPPRRHGARTHQGSQIGRIFREDKSTPDNDDLSRLAEGAFGAAVIEQRRSAFYRQNFFYGGDPYYGRQFYGAPAYYKD